MSQSFESFGKHILLEKLATGGMAEVYLAKKFGADNIGKLVAIKRILPQFSEQIEFIDMFKDEAKIAVNLSHSNIVSIHEFGVQSNQFFLVMDYVEGRNLRQILNKMKKSGLSFSIEQVLYVIKEVAAGLDHAHRCLDANTGKPLNITHRDMSPQNVMVSFEGEVKVVDFGIAKAEIQIETTRAGTLKGKFGYMSPEQAEGQVVDLRTDIFSLGIVLWELLANDRLFVANNEINTLRKIRDCQVPSLRKINPNIPQELERICNKALARDRNLRYQTAAALHRELNRFLNRQYPDFSPHDFSVFIKTLFASEILENRKKIVEYSKISGPHDPDQQQYRPPGANVPARPVQQQARQATHPQTAAELAESDFAGTHTEQTANSNIADLNTNTKGKKTETQKPSPQVQVQPPPRPEPVLNQPRVPKPPAEQKPKPAKKEPDGFEELRFDPASKPPGGFGTRSDIPFGLRDPSTFSSSSIPGYSRTRPGTYTGIRIQSKRSFLSQHAPNLLFTVIGLAVIATLVMYAYSPQKTKSVVHPVLEILGQSGSTTGTSVKPSEQPVFNTDAPKVKVSMRSQPPNAEIWINGVLVQGLTPTTVELPQDEETLVIIRKQGFSEQRTRYRAKRDYEVLQVNLQRARVAFVDVHVEGKGEIYVNGQKVATSSPLLGHQVPAGEKVVVRAYDPSTGAADEATFIVGENLLKKIVLTPRGGVITNQMPVNPHPSIPNERLPSGQ